MNAFWIGKVNSRRGPAELSYIRPQELIQEVLEMNQFLDSGFAQPLQSSPLCSTRPAAMFQCGELKFSAV